MEYVSVARIVNTHGYKGRMVIVYTAAIHYEFVPGEALFVESGKAKVPYFVSYFRNTKLGEAFLEVEGIITKEEAKLFIKKEIFVETLKSKKNKVFTLSDCIGYRIVTTEEDLGIVNDIFEMPHQNLLQFTYKGKDILLPLHEDLILEIDKKKKRILVIIPEGLLEV